MAKQQAANVIQVAVPIYYQAGYHIVEHGIM
jgi:hypothetical protein